MPQEVKLLKEATLRDLEHLLVSICGSGAAIRFWLPATLGPGLFKESWIVALLASARQKGVTVVDWIGKSTPKRDQHRFGRTIEGLASLVYADSLVNAQGSDILATFDEIKWSLRDREDILEPHDSRASSLTFCAIDEDVPSQPIALMSLDTKDSFVAALASYRRDYFERGLGQKYSERIAPGLFDTTSPEGDYEPIDSDRALGGFVYELFRNTLDHGTKDYDGTAIPGLRWVRIRRHVNDQRRRFIERQARSFPELTTYLETIIKRQGTFKLYEISISDTGLGIIARFLATRPDYALHSLPGGPAALLNRIIEDALSSKRTQSGAGRGLQKALRAVDRLQGFVSLRTDRLWLFRSSPDGTPLAQEHPLLPVRSERDLAQVRGTHFNMLFPMV